MIAAWWPRAAIALRLQQEAAAELKKQGLAGAALHTVSRIHIRYQGTDTALACEMPGQMPPLEALHMIRERVRAQLSASL